MVRKPYLSVMTGPGPVRRGQEDLSARPLLLVWANSFYVYVLYMHAYNYMRMCIVQYIHVYTCPYAPTPG